uniref:Uncharacterized protein n=1 Tax=Xiphophorus couchianus TaxID=32473 RepID=A0A3B5M5P3_9TELE
ANIPARIQLEKSQTDPVDSVRLGIKIAALVLCSAGVVLFHTVLCQTNQTCPTPRLWWHCTKNNTKTSEEDTVRWRQNLADVGFLFSLWQKITKYFSFRIMAQQTVIIADFAKTHKKSAASKLLFNRPNPNPNPNASSQLLQTSQ